MRSIGRSVRSVRSVCKIKYSCYPCAKKIRVRSVCKKIFVLFELFVFKKPRVQKISCSKDLVVKRVRSMCNDYSCSKNTIKNK